MRHKNMNHYLFYLRDSYINSSGKCSILLRYYENRTKRVQINTGISIFPRYWSKTKNTLKNSSEIKDEVKIFEEQKLLADSILNHYKKKQATLSTDKFKQHFLNKDFSEFNEIKIEFYNELDIYSRENWNC